MENTTLTLNVTLPVNLAAALLAMLPQASNPRPHQQDETTPVPQPSFGVRRSTTAAVIKTLRCHPVGLPIREISRLVGKPNNHIQASLNKLMADNTVKRTPDPEWRGRFLYWPL